MAKVELEQDRSTETEVLMEEEGANEEVTAAQGQPFSKNGSPLRPPLNQPEEDGSEEENDEDSSPLDPLYSHAQEDLGPPIGAAPKRKGKKRASSPRLPVERSRLRRPRSALWQGCPPTDSRPQRSPAAFSGLLTDNDKPSVFNKSY